MFASEARKNLGLAIYQAGRGNVVDQYRLAVYLALFNGLGATLMRAAWRDLRDDEDEEVFDERHWSPSSIALTAAVDSLQLRGVPLVGDAAETAIFKGAGEWAPEGTVFSAIPRGAAAIRRMLTDDDYTGDKFLKDSEAILTAAGLFNDDLAAGASIMHVVRDAVGVAENVAD